MIQEAPQAIMHCHITTPTAHFVPISLLMELIAAMQGVYNRLNTRIDAAVDVDSDVAMFPPNNTPSVDTTLSFAINPLINAVQMRQSPMPSG